MTWVWEMTQEFLEFGGQYDFGMSEPFTGIENYSTEPVAEIPGKRPVFKYPVGLKRIRKYHCPHAGSDAVVDVVWRDIILKFVPADRIQFFPIRLVYRRETCDDYFWVIPFDRVVCIDEHRSNISSKTKSLKDGKTIIFGVREYVHIPNCMRGLHLARDEQQSSHLLVSNELRDALAATGESSMFYRAEDVPTFANPFGLLKSQRNQNPN